MGAPEDAKLFNAIGRRDPALIRHALARGARPNARGHATLYGRVTALQVAAEKLDDVAVGMLLAAGASQSPGRHKVTPLIELMCAIPSATTPELEKQLLACLQKLLSRKPNLAHEGGDPTRSTGNPVFHCLRQPRSALVDQVESHLFEAMSRRRKFSAQFSASVLLAAFNFRSPDTFERLVGLGLDPQALDLYAAGPPLRLVQNPDLEHLDEWWEVLARHDVPVGKGGSVFAPSSVALAQAKLDSVKMNMRFSSTAPAPVPRARL